MILCTAQLQHARRLIRDFEREHGRRPNTIRIGTRHPFTGFIGHNVYGLRVRLDPMLPEAGMQATLEASKILDSDGKPYTVEGQASEISAEEGGE